MLLFVFSDCTVDSNYVKDVIDYISEMSPVKQGLEPCIVLTKNSTSTIAQPFN